MLEKNNELSKKYNSKKKIYVFVTILCLILVLIVLYFWFLSSRRSSVQSEETVTSQVELENKLIKGKYLFSGTVVLDRAVEKYAYANLDQPFSGLESFNPKQYDGWLIDLECPVTEKDITFQQQIINPVFNCNEEWLPSMSKYFNLINLANNHSSDLGREGFIKTQQNLDNNSIQVVGNYDPSVSQDACEVMALPVRVIDSNNKSNQGKLPVAFCAFHYFERQPLPGEMDIVKTYSDIMPVFGFMHVGVEYVSTAGTDQQNVAHSLIDLGTEFVIGNSPHWVQNSEVYREKPIFYSTGNFIFDQLETETNRGLSIDVEIEVLNDENLSKWLELSNSCQIRGDDCIQQAKQKGLTKPDLKLTYSPVGNISGARIVTAKADAATQAKLEERLNWAQTKQLLGQ